MSVGKETVTETLGNKARTKQRVTARLPVQSAGAAPPTAAPAAQDPPGKGMVATVCLRRGSEKPSGTQYSPTISNIESYTSKKNSSYVQPGIQAQACV